MNPFDKHISGEIVNDEFADAMRKIVTDNSIVNVLEIGAGSGDGSTASLVDGLLENKNKNKLLCSIEISAHRADKVRNKYMQFDFVRVYNGCSVMTNEYFDEPYVREFYNRTKTALNNHSIETVLQWRKNEIEYVESRNCPVDLIETIKQENKIKIFDFVLIDGSEFTGVSELSHVIGAKYIALDDIDALKNLDTYSMLNAVDSNYELHSENWHLRNGYAIFKLK